MLEYLKPQNAAALFVVWVLWGLFACWCAIVAQRARTFRRAAGTARSLTALMPVLAATRRDIETLRESGAIVDPAGRFRAEIEAAGLAPARPVTRLAGAIFAAGVAESRLELAELLAQVERALLSGEPALRTLLSAFLVIGLIGTLFGLADSIVHLTRLMDVTSAVAVTLRQMLYSLKGAFAPSISGALASVLGSFVYSAYLYCVARPALLRIRGDALESWIPALCPTREQAVQEAADRAVRHAVHVVEAAERIDRDTTRLREAVVAAASSSESYATNTSAAAATASQVAQTLHGAVAALSTPLTQLADAANRWSAFDGQMAEFYDSMAKSEKTVAENQAAIRRQIEVQTGALKRSLGDIEQAAEKMHAPVAQAASKMGAAADEFGASLDHVTARFASSVETHTASLKQAHIDELAELKRALAELSDRTRNLGAPFQNAATEMIDTTRNLWKQTLAATERVELASRDQLAVLRQVLDGLGAGPRVRDEGAAPGNLNVESLLREQTALSKGILEAIHELIPARPASSAAAPSAAEPPRPADAWPEWQPRPDPELYSAAMQQLAETREIAAAMRTLSQTASEVAACLKDGGAPLGRAKPWMLTTINSHL